MLDRFYTYSYHENDLHIHAWEFVEKNNDGLGVYYNQKFDKTTTVIPYDNKKDFCTENDVFETRLEVVLELEETYDYDEVRLVLDE